jgi:hypothetical protein
LRRRLRWQRQRLLREQHPWCSGRGSGISFGYFVAQENFGTSEKETSACEMDSERARKQRGGEKTIQMRLMIVSSVVVGTA